MLPLLATTSCTVTTLYMSPIDLMKQALAAPFGIAVSVSDPTALRDQCYKARRELNGAEPSFASLSFHLFRDELYIISIGDTVG